MLPKTTALLIASISFVTLAQDAAASRPDAAIVLPSATQAKPFDEAGPISVSVFRDPAAPKSSDVLTWRIGLNQVAYTLSAADVEDRLSAGLQSAGAARAPKKASASSDQALLISADANAPYALVEKVLACAPRARLNRIFFEAKSTTEGQKQAVFCRFPTDYDPPDPNGLPDIRLKIGVVDRGVVARTFDLSTRRIPVGPDGDQQLENLLRIKRDDYAKGWKVEVPVVIEAQSNTPWMQVLNLVDLAYRVGAKRIEFAAAQPAEKEKVLPDTPTAPPKKAPGIVPDESPDTEPGAESKPAPPITLPAADGAIAFVQRDPIVVTVYRIDDGGESRPRQEQEWGMAIGGRRYGFNKAGVNKLAGYLIQRARRRMPKGSGLSNQPLLISADAAAKYSVIQKTLEASAFSRIYKIWVETAPSASGERQALKCWLPVSRVVDETGGVIPEIRVIMSWNSQQNKVERLFGQSLVPMTKDGDARLEKLIKESAAEYAATKVKAPLIVDAGPLMPWRHIVDVMNVAERLDLPFEFGFGTEMK